MEKPAVLNCFFSESGSQISVNIKINSIISEYNERRFRDIYDEQDKLGKDKWCLKYTGQLSEVEVKVSSIMTKEDKGDLLLSFGRCSNSEGNEEKIYYKITEAAPVSGISFNKPVDERAVADRILV